MDRSVVPLMVFAEIFIFRLFTYSNLDSMYMSFETLITCF